jgi:hypothetical protein
LLGAAGNFFAKDHQRAGGEAGVDRLDHDLRPVKDVVQAYEVTFQQTERAAAMTAAALFQKVQSMTTARTAAGS